MRGNLGHRWDFLLHIFTDIEITPRNISTYANRDGTSLALIAKHGDSIRLRHIEGLAGYHEKQIKIANARAD